MLARFAGPFTMNLVDLRRISARHRPRLGGRPWERNPAPPPPPPPKPAGSLAAFACPNPDCTHFNRLAAGNLSTVEWTGKRKDIRRLYCSACKRRFTERQGTLLRYCKLPEETVVRIVKCLGHGCSVEATADICEVDPRTVGRLLEQAGRRAAADAGRQSPALPVGAVAGLRRGPAPPPQAAARPEEETRAEAAA